MSPQWVFDPLPASKTRRGGIAADQVFDADIDTFVREVLQNSIDQAMDDGDEGDKLHVDVRFTLLELTGSLMDDLLEAVDWEALSDHLESSERSGGTTIAGRLREGLELIETGTLRVMMIEDRNTHGLTGGEDEKSDSNFANLCKHELVTSAERKESGGSFGIGKSVLWRFSTLSTVLFSSRPSDRDSLRFIGRSYLPSHDTDDGSWEGSGWFGELDETGPLPRAVSMSGEAAEATAGLCRIEREPEDFGTSIMVLGFDDPEHEDEPSVLETCESIADSAQRWFWPAISSGRLAVTVEGREDWDEVFSTEIVDAGPEVAPFVEALHGETSDTNSLGVEGDIVERPIVVQIPQKNDGRGNAAGPGVDARALLRVRLAKPSEGEDLVNTVALQRGTGMVIRYYSPPTGATSGSAVHAVFIGGLAHGDSGQDHALEAFLRAAEPPAHSDWKSSTERLKAEYVQKGRRKALLGIQDQIDEVFAELLSRVDVISEEVPDFLRKMLPLKGTGRREPKPKSSLNGTSAYLTADGKWQFEGTFVRRDSSPEPWQFRIALEIDQEGSGKKTAVPTSELTTAGCEHSVLAGDRGQLVHVPAGLAEIPFSGLSDRVPVTDSHRVQIRLVASLCDTEGKTL